MPNLQVSGGRGNYTVLTHTGTRVPDNTGGPSMISDKVLMKDTLMCAIQDPTHAEHRAMLEWIGGSFDPVAFGIEDTNERLSLIKP
jgi:hypothetical protein